MILGDRPENDPAYKNPKTGSEKGAVFEVKLPTGFTSGTLRVKATNKKRGNFQGFVDDRQCAFRCVRKWFFPSKIGRASCRERV